MLSTKLVELLPFVYLWTLVSGYHEFSIPKGCKYKNTKYPLSSVSWSCFVFNWNKMSCWFDIEKIFNREIHPGESYNITVSYQVNYISFPAYSYTEVSPSDRCLQKLNFAGDVGVTIFKLKFSHSNESMTRLIQFDNKQVVKPERIKGLQTYQTKSTIHLKWKCPSTHEGMEFRIRYRSEYARNNNMKEWEERKYIWIMSYSDYIFHFYNYSLPSNCSVTLTNLTSFTSYDLAIDVIPRNGNRSGFWSDAFKIAVTTDDDIPQAVPEFYPGYFSSVNESCVKIYWKPISRVKRCGNITNYRVTIITLNDKESNKEILIPPTKVSLDTMIDPNEVSRIELTQMNRRGYPKVPDAHIFVFPDNSRPPLPTQFKVETLNNSLVLLTWKISPETDNSSFKELSSVTVVWCKGTLPNICFEPLESRIFPLHIESMNTSTVISLGIGNYSDYIYGLSLGAETIEGLLISSGIHWYEDCVYHINGEPPIGPVIERKLPYNHNAVLVQWKPYTCQQSGGVSGSFLIRFCETMGKVCKGHYQTKNASIDKHSYVLSNLRNGHRYSIQVGTKHKFEETNGPWSEPVYYDVPEVQGSQNIVIVGSSATAGVVAFVILITIGVRLLRHKCKKADEETRIDYTVAIKKTTNTTEYECLLEKKKTFGGDSGFDGSGELRYNDTDDSNVTRLHRLNSHDENSVIDGLVINQFKEQTSEHNNTSHNVPIDSDMNDGTYREFIMHSSDDDSDTSSTETDSEISKVSGQQIQHDIVDIPDILLLHSPLNERSSLEETSLTIDSYCKGYQNTDDDERIEPAERTVLTG
ncbi:Hypothetical predicted protein [Mytilus galloprovincialis]|uniref:Fibronectin type-III domain-containing protein n=1 Tax=Mytilus galloprovincialis TaxID=29158 RepID=A0A8B6EX50_MYTGA|nr:Hypothetical predicted protein [Mytilus galloprovincialis]